MGKEFSTPEEWANCRADKLATVIRKSAERQKLPKAGMIGSDRLLKIARAIWDRIGSQIGSEIERCVKEETLKWASESFPHQEGNVPRIGHAVNGKVQRRDNL